MQITPYTVHVFCLLGISVYPSETRQYVDVCKLIYFEKARVSRCCAEMLLCLTAFGTIQTLQELWEVFYKVLHQLHAFLGYCVGSFSITYMSGSWTL